MSTAAPAEPFESIDELLEMIEAKTDLQNFTEADALYWREDWDVLQPLLINKIRRRRLDHLTRYFVRHGRKQAISEWIDKHLTRSDTFEKNLLKNEIGLLVDQDREEELREYLSDVLERGWKKARQRLKSKQRGNGGYLGHAWHATIALVQLGIVVATLATATSKFETIVFAGLALTYSSFRGTSLVISNFTEQVAIRIDGQFRVIRRLLKEEISDEERGERYELEQKIQESIGRDKIRLWIRSIGFSLISVVALFALLRALV